MVSSGSHNTLRNTVMPGLSINWLTAHSQPGLTVHRNTAMDRHGRSSLRPSSKHEISHRQGFGLRHHTWPDVRQLDT